MADGPPLDAGFDRGFLRDHEVELPTPASDEVRGDLLVTKAGATTRDCTHFSVAMSTSRRICRWAAWNISASDHRPTTARHFKLDPEYDETAQITDGFYVNNRLDQGHIAAFADVSWGTEEEAARARDQSCYFSNITPQLDAFNRSNLHGVWGELENSINEENDVTDERLSVLGGPVLRSDDVPFHDMLVPRDFWKVVAYVEDGELKAKAFQMTQRDLEGGLEGIMLDEYRAFQRRVGDLGDELGLDLGSLVAADTAPAPESLVAGAERGVRRITSVAEINAEGW
jgi:endonuclease G, mitochondrial